MKHNIKKIHLLSWKQYPIGAFTEFFGKKILIVEIQSTKN